MNGARRGPIRPSAEEQKTLLQRLKDPTGTALSAMTKRCRSRRQQAAICQARPPHRIRKGSRHSALSGHPYAEWSRSAGADPWYAFPPPLVRAASSGLDFQASCRGRLPDTYHSYIPFQHRPHPRRSLREGKPALPPRYNNLLRNCARTMLSDTGWICRQVFRIPIESRTFMGFSFVTYRLLMCDTCAEPPLPPPESGHGRHPETGAPTKDWQAASELASLPSITS